MIQELYLAWWALIAEIAGTIAGFGSSSIFLPVALQFLTYQNALILVAIYHIFGNLSRFSMFWRHRNSKIFWLFGIPSVIATVLWARLAGMIDPHILKIILWITLIIYALYSLLSKPWNITISPRVWRLWWALSGFSAWLIWTWWVLRWAFMTLFNLSKESYIATIASVALLVDMTRIPVYFRQWFMDKQYYIYIPFLFVIAFIWSYIWKLIVKNIDTWVLRKIIYVAIFLLSGLLVWQWTIWINSYIQIDNTTWLPTIQREWPRPQTSDAPLNSNLAHQQSNQRSNIEMQEQVWAYISSFPNTKTWSSLISVEWARAVFLEEISTGPTLVQKEWIHIHPPEDGSLHVAVPIDRASEIERLWRWERHPRNPSTVMLYWPRNEHELNIIKKIVDAIRKLQQE